MYVRATFLALLMTIPLAFTTPHAQQNRLRVGVMDLESETIPAPELRILSNRLRVEIHKTDAYNLIERDRMEAILEEQGFQLSECVATECVVEVGQILGVEKMIAGDVGRIGRMYTMSLRLIDIASGSIEHVASEDCRDCGIEDVVISALARVAAQISGRRAPERTPPYPTPTTWTAGPAMPTARVSPAAAEIGGMLYVAGGLGGMNTLEIYDPTTNTWTTGPAMPTARVSPAAAEIGGMLYVAGGLGGMNTLEIYNPATNAWTTGRAMPTGRSNLAAAAIGGKLYVVGGWNGSKRLNTLEIYDPATNTWTTGPAMPTTRHGLAAVAIGGKLYVAGGSDDGKRWNLLEIFDSATNAWTTGRAMPTGRSNLAAAEIGGKLYVTGGSDGGKRSNLLEIYDPVTNTWTTGPAMPTARSELAAAAIGGKLYVAGGFGGMNTLEIFRW